MSGDDLVERLRRSSPEPSGDPKTKALLREAATRIQALTRDDEVTPEMLSAGIDAYRENPSQPRSHGELVEAIYTAMRDAALRVGGE